MRSFVEGWFDGDAGTTSSEQLCVNFSYVLKIIGKKYSLYKEPGREVFFKGENRIILSDESYRLYLFDEDKNKRNVIGIGDDFIGRRVKKINKVSRPSKVYDIGVDNDSHLFFCGKTPLLVHNSWDLFSGFPANLAGIQVLKEYMAGEIGVEDGEMIVESKGLHLYGYAEDLAKLRCMKE